MILDVIGKDHYNDKLNKQQEITKVVENAKVAEEKTPRKAKRSNLKTKVIAVTTLSVFIAGAALCIKDAHEKNQGEAALVNKYWEEMGNYGLSVRETSNGYQFSKNNNHIDESQAIVYFKDVAEICGYDLAETYIAVKEVVSDVTAKNVVGEENIPSFEQIQEAKELAYHESEAKGIRNGK